MKIHIKQPEIESALRDYISKLGINLQGRAVEVSFTSGRKNNGLSADIDISDVLISLDTVAEDTPVQTTPTPDVASPDPTPVIAPSLDEAQEEEEALELETATSTTSLFS